MRVLGTSENVLCMFVTLLPPSLIVWKRKFGETTNSIQHGDYATGSPRAMGAYLLLACFFLVCVCFVCFTEQ